MQEYIRIVNINEWMSEWIRKKEKLILTVEYQLINVKGLIELENSILQPSQK